MDTKASGAGVTHQRPENLLQRRELHQLLNHPWLGHFQEKESFGGTENREY